jgi:phage repressor protein C with HTH and peptisase S24 domain
MDKAPNRIRELREALGWSQTDLALKLVPKTSQPQIDRLEKADRRLTVDWMGRVAAALKVSPRDLLSPDKASIRAHALVASADKTPSVTLASGALGALSGPKDLPILGYVKAGTEGFFIVNGEVQGYTVRPDMLSGVKDAYSVYIHDKSMFPAFEPGHLAWVDPLRPVKPGDAVVIQLADGQAFIKRLKRRTEKVLICEQWNPAGEVRYDAAAVRAIHLVVGSMRVMS